MLKCVQPLQIPANFESKVSEGRRYPISAGEDVVGELVMLRALPGDLSVPLPLVVGMILLTTAAAYFFSNIFAQSVSQQADRLTSLVNRTTLKRGMPEEDRPVIFSEFRRLRAGLIRRLQHMQRENERLMSTAYTDERTGL